MTIQNQLVNCAHCKGLEDTQPLCPAHFKALQSKWYGKLKDSGFEDAEQDDAHLKTWSNLFAKIKPDDVVFQAKEEYYRLAGNFLYEYAFEDELIKEIWALHSEGTSVREIVVHFKAKGSKIYKDKVHKILQRLVKQMFEFYRYKAYDDQY